MAIVFSGLAALVFAAAALFAWRQLDHRADRVAWNTLVELAGGNAQRFDPSMVADLPEPARRYFAFTIARGTPIRTTVRIEMSGQLGNGMKDAPNYQPMQASQILTPPHGLVWKVKAGPLSGSDGAMPDRSWTRFWLFNLLPIVRADGADHHRSAFGRVVAEAAFWAPASLLPGEHVQWEAMNDDTARAIVRFGAFTQAVDITVDASGAPTEVAIQRWSNENPDKVFREQPFGGYPSEYQLFDGYRLPTHVECGNHFGTLDYFPFFIANVSEIGSP